MGMDVMRASGDGMWIDSMLFVDTNRVLGGLGDVGHVLSMRLVVFYVNDGGGAGAVLGGQRCVRVVRGMSFGMRSRGGMAPNVSWWLRWVMVVSLVTPMGVDHFGSHRYGQIINHVDGYSYVISGFIRYTKHRLIFDALRAVGAQGCRLN